ncbi:MAG: hydroxyacid dehydrogenase [Proteobacteria bacterium]|nr:hydroxyacid dehydrogenase [Pseudomonadota bacterium]
MKAILPYDASPAIRRILDGVDRDVVRIVLLDEHDDSAFARELVDADILLHVLAPVTAAIMATAPKLRLVQKIGVGVDAIDRAYARSRGIAVCNMPGTNTVAVAELTLALMLACLRRIASMDADLRAGGGWPAAQESLDRAGEIHGACVGLIGYGAVARQLTPILRALGARVIAHTRHASDSGVEFVALDALLAQADIVSLHLPLTPETRNLLDAGRIAGLKHGAIVVNTARGALIDEVALVSALHNGRIAAAGLDVFADEPIRRDSPLLGLRNVVATPHIAWMTAGTWKRSIDVVLANCKRLATGEALLHRVP